VGRLPLKENIMPEAITYFDSFEGHNDWAFLSNFYIGAEPLWVNDKPYMTGEHLFQAWKARTKKVHERIRKSKSPGMSKMRGKMCDLRPDWEEIKYDVMRFTLKTKFTTAREEGHLLLNTGDALLIEGTDWNDKVWGTERSEERFDLWPGRNWLGTLLMARRAELRAERLFGSQNRVDIFHNEIKNFIEKS
jgi:N-glycosidase YbiA